ncbi:MAG: hypothetical protein P8046_05585 [Anaerolineales bacterium]
MSKRIFISADHGLAVIYFLQSDVVPTLIEAGVEVVLLTDEDLIDKIKERFGQPGLIVESLKIKKASNYLNTHQPVFQFWMDYLRRAGGSNRINLEAVNSYVRGVKVEAEPPRSYLLPLTWLPVFLMRNFRLARKWFVKMQRMYNPHLYTDLFEKFQPDLVIASTPAWRLDRYLLREAAERGVPTASVIVGWDNPSSYTQPGIPMDWITCWSELQKDELVYGSDWDEEQVFIGGIPYHNNVGQIFVNL